MASKEITQKATIWQWLQQNSRMLLAVLLGSGLLAMGLAAVSQRAWRGADWLAFWLAMLLGAGLLAAAWWLLKKDTQLHLPAWLAGLLVFAALLRLGLGAFWYAALPVWGYPQEVQQAGYVMSDAYERDRAAWELASTEKPLWAAFRDFRAADQYGGLLFVSAVLYRYLGAQTHLPLLVVVLAAAFSSLAVLLTYAFAWRTWGNAAAALSAWILALYPDAVLLGSSQMREAFTITLAAAAFYGLTRYWQHRTTAGLAWMAAALLLCVPFSPPFAGVLLLLLAVYSLGVGGRDLLRQRRIWVVIGLLALLALAGIWVAWSEIAPKGIENPIELVTWWLKQSARWQAHLTERASGWIQKIFKSTPGWLELPILLAYGVVQPFLPAALLDDGAPIWKGIAIWRATGWTLLLAALLYGFWKAWSRRGDWQVKLLSLLVWLGILLAALRGGGDQWDNPRYRVTFGVLQAALAGWVWLETRQTKDAGLRRAAMALGAILFWFLPWYLRRYSGFDWPVQDVFKTLGLGVVSAVLIWTIDWARSQAARGSNVDDPSGGE